MTEDKQISAAENPLEKEKKTLHHTPVLSEDFEIFSHEHEHYFAQEKKRKKKAIIALSTGVSALFAIGIIGFFSSTPIQKEYITASIFNIPALTQSISREDCLQKIRTLHLNKKKGSMFCEKKFQQK